MAKKVVAMVKLQCPAGQANPSPPVGPALGQHGVNIMEFCKAFNARTQDKQGLIIPAVITVYSDRTFTFELRTPPFEYQTSPLIPWSFDGRYFEDVSAAAVEIFAVVHPAKANRQTPNRALRTDPLLHLM